MAWLDGSTFGMTNSYWLAIGSVVAVGAARQAARRAGSLSHGPTDREVLRQIKELATRTRNDGDTDTSNMRSILEGLSEYGAELGVQAGTVKAARKVLADTEWNSDGLVHRGWAIIGAASEDLGGPKMRVGLSVTVEFIGGVLSDHLTNMTFDSLTALKRVGDLAAKVAPSGRNWREGYDKFRATVRYPTGESEPMQFDLTQKSWPKEWADRTEFLVVDDVPMSAADQRKIAKLAHVVKRLVASGQAQRAHKSHAQLARSVERSPSGAPSKSKGKVDLDTLLAEIQGASSRKRRQA